MQRNLLLLSNSTNASEEYLGWPKPYIKNFLKKFSVRSVVFIPFAGVNLSSEGLEQSYNIFEERVRGIFREFGIELNSIHHSRDPRLTVKKAECIVIGGGNTFYLVKMLHENGIMNIIREQVKLGIPYVGWSAGANVACPSMKTTNDMPIAEPSSFSCLDLVPFQINPHYIDTNPAGHAGETREERIIEFLSVNRKVKVAGLREGCLFWIEGDSIELKGKKPLRVFSFGQAAREYSEGEPLDFLLRE